MELFFILLAGELFFMLTGAAIFGLVMFSRKLRGQK